MTAPAASPALSERDIRAILIGTILAMFLAAIDQTIIATALPTIGRELGDIEHMAWIVTAYLLASTVVTPLYGKFSDIHGRRIALLIAISIFGVGSILCALAPSMWVLIGARAIQGLGGGGLISLGQTIFADIVSPKERAKYQVYFAGVFASSSLLGPVLGGFIAEHLHWSVIFWINLPVGLAAFLLSDNALKRLPRHDRPHKLDWAGAGLLVVATVTLLLALNWGGIRFPWTSIEIIGLIAASLVVFGLFATRLMTAAEPLIPLSVLGNPVVRSGALSAFFGMGTFIGLSIYVPVFFETVKGLSASESGMALIPFMVGTVSGATLSGRFMGRVTHYKRVPMVGILMTIAATVALVAYAETLPFGVLLVLFTVISAGLGTILPVTTVAIQNAVQPHQMGAATGMMNFLRSLGGAFIVAAFGAILLSMTLGAGAVISFDSLQAVGPAVLTGAFRAVFIAALIGFIMAFLMLAAMEEKPLRSGRPVASRDDAG